MVAFGSLEIPPGTVSVLLSLEWGGGAESRGSKLTPPQLVILPGEGSS